MSKKYYTPEKLNEEIEKMIDKGFMPPTRLYKFQEGHTRIVIGNELMGSGFIRTYDEALKFIKRKDKNAIYTLKEYKQELRSLQDSLGRLRTEQGVTRANRARLLEILKSAGIDGRKYTTQQMNTAVKLAQDRVRDEKAKSPQFYEYLTDALES